RRKQRKHDPLLQPGAGQHGEAVTFAPRRCRMMVSEFSSESRFMKLTPPLSVNQVLIPLLAALRLIAPAFPAPAPKPARVRARKVGPAAITLAGGRDQRRVVVSGRLTDGSWIDLTRSARFTLPRGLVALDRDGFFAPVKAGSGQIGVSAGGRQARI